MENIEFKKSAVDASYCISEGWNLVKPNFGLFVAMVVVQIVILIASGLIPYAGSIINVIVSGALACGIYITLLARRRGADVPFSLMFEGFSRLLPTTLVTLIGSIPWLVLGIAAYFFISLPSLIPGADGTIDVSSETFSRAALVPLVLAYLATALVSLVFHLLLFFALPLIADRNLGIGDALKLSVSAAAGNIGGLTALLIFEILLSLAGVLLCCVGFILVLPVIYAANIIAYKSVFPDDERQFNNEPPRPEDYGGTYGTAQ
ncbi:MAG: hypothetical protein M3525_04775 [Acidobacteriota bacterium]|nr:hypothetical protein [Acidobacteriota bacterium]